MAVNWDRVCVGDVLYESIRQSMGNTTMRETVVYEVKIISKDNEEGSCMVSWNSNLPQKWYRSSIEKLRRKKPELKPSLFAQARAAMKERDAHVESGGSTKAPWQI
jgi:hypothetical protein